MTQIQQQIAARLRKVEHRIVPDKNTGCWIWTGSTTKKGYPQMHFGKGPANVHRLMAALSHGFDMNDPQIEIKRTCKNQSCVQPKHLFVHNMTPDPAAVALKNSQFLCGRVEGDEGLRFRASLITRGISMQIALREAIGLYLDKHETKRSGAEEP